MKRSTAVLLPIATCSFAACLSLARNDSAEAPAARDAPPPAAAKTIAAVDEGAPSADPAAPSEPEVDVAAKSEPAELAPSAPPPPPARTERLIDFGDVAVQADLVKPDAEVRQAAPRGKAKASSSGGAGRGAGMGIGSGVAGPRQYAASTSVGEAETGVESGSFSGREDAKVNAPTLAATDHLSTFAVDVDTAAYSIARRSLKSGQLPTTSLVRVEEVINYFRYDYDPPTSAPFSIQLDGAQSPVDGSKHFLRVGLQARVVKDADRLPANLVFLIDTSCSMTSGDKLELAKKSLEIAVDHLGAKDTVAITTYAGGVSLVLPPTPASEKEAIKRALRSLAPGGGTAMESGLTLAYQQAARMLRDGTITRIIVCSDGDANIGATSHHEMLKKIEGYVKEGVTLSTIGFGDGNYKDQTMEGIANKGNGNYFYVDTVRQAQRVFGRDLTKMIQDVAQDVKVQVDFEAAQVKSYRLVGYENRDVADRDFRNDQVDAGEIGAGHQVTALYELVLAEGASPNATLATVRVRAKAPRGTKADETSRSVTVAQATRPFERAPEDLRFAVAVMGGAELLRASPHADAWSFDRVINLVSDSTSSSDPDRVEFVQLMRRARDLGGSQRNRISSRY